MSTGLPANGWRNYVAELALEAGFPGGCSIVLGVIVAGAMIGRDEFGPVRWIMPAALIVLGMAMVAVGRIANRVWPGMRRRDW